MRPEERKPKLTSSKEVSVCDRAKLTCLVLKEVVGKKRDREKKKRRGNDENERMRKVKGQ